jgi:hypothetical protein
MLKGIVSRDEEGVLMIPVYRWNACVSSPQTLKFLECCFPFQFLKRSKVAAGHFYITTQMLSVNP